VCAFHKVKKSGSSQQKLLLLLLLPLYPHAQDPSLAKAFLFG